MSRDYDRLPAHAEAMIKWAMIGLMARRLAPAPAAARGNPWPPPDLFLNTLSERAGALPSSTASLSGAERRRRWSTTRSRVRRDCPCLGRCGGG